MELYFAEAIVAIIFAIIITIVLKIKKIKKVSISLGILMVIFIIVLGGTYLLEKPQVANIDKQLNFEVNQKTFIEAPKTSYHFKDVTNTVKVVGEVAFDKIGEYEIQYEIPTLIGTYKVNQTVDVVDTTAPEIILKGEESYQQSYAKEYAEPGYDVKDNYDENLVDKVQISKEEIGETEYNIIYTVEDNSGNKATKIRKVYIVDDVPPVITLNGNESMQILLNSTYKEKGATAIDEKDGDLTSKIEITGSVNTSKEGTYAITYKVADNSNNETTKTRKVVVYSKEKQKTVQAQNGTNGTKGVIYLTFDDGPTTSITPKILNILKEKNVKATFFILNYDSNEEKLVKREIEEGHTVAIHGYSHDYKKIYQSVDAYMSNITKLQEKIKKSTGCNTIITRFPGGSSNTVSRYNPGIMTRLCNEVVARGYKYFDWNVSSGDAGGARTSQDVYNNVTKGLKKDRANVVLMHDFSGNTKTVNALRDIIDYGLANRIHF
ncbi:MAG: polysaccharide deacetylase family protein [Clostridia bacterium]|nr:polysaccharide deacetylase family protein [Clostridia bacterium]